MGSKSLPLTLMRISSGSCPVFHGGAWTGKELEKAISRNQCLGIHPVHTHRDPARSGFPRPLILLSYDTQLASWWHFQSSATELSRQIYLAFPALFFLIPSAPSSTLCPAWLSALLLCLVAAFSLSSHGLLLLFSPSSCDSSSCFLFVSHAPLLPHPYSLPPHSCTLPLMSRTCLYSLTQKPVSLPRLLLSAGE